LYFQDMGLCFLCIGAPEEKWTRGIEQTCFLVAYDIYCSYLFF
jgi:hypothetical protein